jgi:FkbM family methyltransferase
VRISRVWSVMRTFRNPWAIMGSRYGWGAPTKTAVLKSGPKFLVRNGSRDVNIIFEVFGARVYHRYLDLLSKGGTVIDIGANIGAFTILAAHRAPNVRVFSYEPFQDNFKQLIDNVALNHLESRVQAFSLAVGGRCEQRRLMISNLSGGHSFYGGDCTNSVVIDVITMEQIFSDTGIDRCDFLKIDCEGAEYEIIYSAGADLFRRIRTITLEYHTGNGVGSAVEMKAFLEGRGYRVDYTGTTIGTL